MSDKRPNKRSSPVQINAHTQPPHKKLRLSEELSITNVNKEFQNFRETIDNEQYCDVIFVAGNGNNKKEFKCIKHLFASQSSSLPTRLYESNAQSQMKRIELTNVSVAAFEFIKNKCYFLQPKLTAQYVSDIWFAANKYNFIDIEKECESFLNNVTDETDIFIIIKSMKENPFVSIKNMTTLLASEGCANTILNSNRFASAFGELEVQLFMKHTKCNDQKLKFKALLKWYNGNHEFGAKETVLKPMLKYINMESMDHGFLYNTVRLSHVMSNDEFLGLLALKWKHSRLRIEDYMLNQQELDALKVGDKIDLRDEYEIALVEITSRNGMECKVKWNAYDDSNDPITDTIDVSSPNVRSFRANSMNPDRDESYQCPNDHSNINTNDFVIVNLAYVTAGKDDWYRGKIVKVDCNCDDGEFCFAMVKFDRTSGLSETKIFLDNPDEFELISGSVMQEIDELIDKKKDLKTKLSAKKASQKEMKKKYKQTIRKLKTEVKPMTFKKYSSELYVAFQEALSEL